MPEFRRRCGLPPLHHSAVWGVAAVAAVSARHWSCTFSSSAPPRLRASRSSAFGLHRESLRRSPRQDGKHLSASRALAFWHAGPRLVDYSGVAIGFFGNLRITSALLTGASLGFFFNPPPVDGAFRKMNYLARYVYIMCTSLTVAHCLMVCFICTIATTSVVVGSVPTLAASAEGLLMGPLRLEYMSCRAFFLTSLIFFETAIAAKLLGQKVAGKDTTKGEKFLAFGVMCFFLHTVSAQMAYINYRIRNIFGNLFLLYVDAVIQWLRRFNPSVGIAGVMTWITFAGFLAGTCSGLIMIFSDSKK